MIKVDIVNEVSKAADVANGRNSGPRRCWVKIVSTTAILPSRVYQ